MPRENPRRTPFKVTPPPPNRSDDDLMDDALYDLTQGQEDAVTVEEGKGGKLTVTGPDGTKMPFTPRMSEPLAEKPDTATPPPPVTAGEMAEEGRELAGEAKDAVIGGALDVGRGVIESGTQAAGGALDAVNEALQVEHELVRWLDENVADLSPGGEMGEPGRVPTTPEAASLTGGAVRSVTSFLTGYGAVGAVAGPLAAGRALTAGGRVARGIVQGAGAEVISIDEQEARLSDLLNEVPGLRGPVLEYLATSPEDSFGEAKLKQSIDGVVSGVAVEGLLLSFRALKSARRAKVLRMRAEAGYLGSVPPPKSRAVPIERFAILGDFNAPAVMRVAPSDLDRALAGKLDAAQGEADAAIRAAASGNLSKVGDDVFINFARIETPDDVKKTIQEVANSFRTQIDEAKRGVRTHADTIAAAQEINAWDVIAARRQGQALNAEEGHALRELWVASGRKLTEVADLATQVPLAENLYAFRRMLAVHHAIQAEAMGARAETARSLNAWKIPVSGGDMERLKGIEALLFDNGGGEEVTKHLASRIAALRGRPEFTEALSVMAEKGAGAKTMDAVRQYWYFALLSAPPTHFVNTLSNATFLLQQIPERALAARLTQIAGTEEGVALGEAAAMSEAMIGGFKDALSLAARSARTGETGYGISQIENRTYRAFGEAATAWKRKLGQNVDPNIPAEGAALWMDVATSLPSRAMGAQDEFFKTLGYRMELRALAVRQATREVESGKLARGKLSQRVAEIVADPPESLRMEAVDHATYVTFTSAPGPMTQDFLRVRNRLGSVGWVLFPFVNTPVNLMKRSFERTPLAPLVGDWKADMRAGGARRDIAIARAGMGTMITSTFLDFALRGQVTGAGPSDPRQREDWMRRHQPFSIKVGDKWVPYNRLDPIGMQIGWAATFSEIILNREWEDIDWELSYEALGAMTFSAIATVSSKSYMEGITNFVDAMNAPDRYSESYFNQLQSSFVPAAVFYARRLTDDQMRATTDMVESIANRIPGASEGLAPQTDVFARPRLYSSGLGTVYDAFGVFRVRSADQEPIDRELQRLQEAGVDYYLTKPQRSIEDISLSNQPHIYWRYVAMAGNEWKDEGTGLGFKDALNRMVEGREPVRIPYKGRQFEHFSKIEGRHLDYTAAYKAAPTDEMRARLIDELKDYYRRNAKAHVLKTEPWLQEKLKAKEDEKRRAKFGEREAPPPSFQ